MLVLCSEHDRTPHHSRRRGGLHLVAAESSGGNGSCVELYNASPIGPTYWSHENPIRVLKLPPKMFSAALVSNTFVQC